MVYTISLRFDEFRDNFCENMTVKQANAFKDYVNEDGDIDIVYKYEASKNGLGTINWGVSHDGGFVYTTKYTGSSCFAMWWSGVSDDTEKEQDEEAWEELKKSVDALITRMQDREWNLPEEKRKALIEAIYGFSEMVGVPVPAK